MLMGRVPEEIHMRIKQVAKAVSLFAISSLASGALAQAGNTWGPSLSAASLKWPSALEAIHMAMMPPASGNQ
jgi:hypothetical protein